MEIQLWREILAPYQLAVDELVVKFNHIIRESRTRGTYSPIERVEGRVKDLSSILNKMQKKDVNMNDLEEKIKDIAGIRIICQFVEDIYRVVEIIDDRSDMRILEKKDYIKNVKNTGYRSFHLIVEYEVNTLTVPKNFRQRFRSVRWLWTFGRRWNILCIISISTIFLSIFKIS